MTITKANADQFRPPGGDNGGDIVRIDPARRPEAIERLVGGHRGDDHAAAKRFLAYASEHAVRLDGLWSRLGPGGRILASVLAVPSAGRTAMFFATHPRRAQDVPSIAGLIDYACGELGPFGVDLAQ